MSQFLIENAGYIAAWVPRLLVTVGVLAAAVLVFLWRRPSLAPTASLSRRFIGQAARFALVSTVISLIVAYGPTSPLFRSAGQIEAQIGQVAPEMDFHRVSDGGPQRLSGFRGKVVLVNLWATWCPPCREELPTLNRLQEVYRERGLAVVTLSDESPEHLTPFLARYAPETMNGYVESFGWLTIRNFRPFTLVIDRQGVLRDFVFGAQDYRVFERKVQQYLE